MTYTADNLLLDLKRDSYIAASQGNWADPDLLAIASDMITRRLAPMLWSLKQGYFKEHIDQVLTALVGGYDMPSQAMWNKIHFVCLVDTSGNILDTPIRIEPLELPFQHSSTPGTPNAIYYEHAQYILDPVPNAAAAAAYTLRMFYARRPGTLVKAVQAATVLSVNSGTGVVTYSAALPVAFGSTTQHDIYTSVSPYRRKNTKALTATALAGATQTFSLADVAYFAAGDTVNMLEETIYPPVPKELYPSIVELVIARISKSKGDRQAFEDAASEIVKDGQSAMMVMSERDEGRPKKLSLLHSPFLRRAGRRGMPSTPR